MSVPKEFVSAEVGSPSSGRIVGSDACNQFIILLGNALLTNFDIPTLRELNILYRNALVVKLSLLWPCLNYNGRQLTPLANIALDAL